MHRMVTPTGKVRVPVVRVVVACAPARVLFSLLFHEPPRQTRTAAHRGTLERGINRTPISVYTQNRCSAGKAQDVTNLKKSTPRHRREGKGQSPSCATHTSPPVDSDTGTSIRMGQTNNTKTQEREPVERVEVDARARPRVVLAVAPRAAATDPRRRAFAVVGAGLIRR